MKEYLATITFETSLRAKDDDQAQERAAEIAESLRRQGPPKGKSWMGDDWDVSIEVDEADG